MLDERYNKITACSQPQWINLNLLCIAHRFAKHYNIWLLSAYWESILRHHKYYISIMMWIMFCLRHEKKKTESLHLLSSVLMIHRKSHNNTWRLIKQKRSSTRAPWPYACHGIVLLRGAYNPKDSLLFPCRTSWNKDLAYTLNTQFAEKAFIRCI